MMGIHVQGGDNDNGELTYVKWGESENVKVPHHAP